MGDNSKFFIFLYSLDSKYFVKNQNSPLYKFLLKLIFWTNYWNLPNSALASISLGQQWFLVKLDHNLTDMLTVWLVMATTAATPPKMASVVTGSGWTSRKQDAKTRSSVNFMMLVKRLENVRPVLYFFKPKINKRPFILCFFMAFYCKSIKKPFNTQLCFTFSYILLKRRTWKGRKKVTIVTILFVTSQCLKITQNIAFEFFNFGIFHQF